MRRNVRGNGSSYASLTVMQGRCFRKACWMHKIENRTHQQIVI